MSEGINKKNLKYKTVTINPCYKEIYYNLEKQKIEEQPETTIKRNIFWSYMMNVSMQNAVSQIRNVS